MLIATSASFSDADAAKSFVSGLTGLTAQAITALTGEKRAFEPAAEGTADIASAFATVPLAALQSSSLRERSSVVASLAKRIPNARGAPVRLRRIDSSAGEIIVTVEGLDPKGERVEEEVLVPSGGTADTEQRLLVVDEVSCAEGIVAVARRYDLGTANVDGFNFTTDDLPAALAEVLNGLPVIGRLRNITSGAECKSDPMTPKGSAWALSDLPLVLFPKASPTTAVAAVDALLELASLAKAFLTIRQSCRRACTCSSGDFRACGLVRIHSAVKSQRRNAAAQPARSMRNRGKAALAGHRSMNCIAAAHVASRSRERALGRRPASNISGRIMVARMPGKPA